MTSQEAGQLGGLATLNKYGKSFYSVIGAKGGRPRSRQLSAPKPENKVREGLAAQPNNRKVLLELYKLRNNGGGAR